MSLERARTHLIKYGLAERIIEFTTSSATVSLAAAALGTEEARIAKSLSFMTPDGPIVVVVAGDAKVSNKKYKDTFGTKAKMLSYEEVEPLIGHAVGGVCPFGVNEGVRVYLDGSLRRFEQTGQISFESLVSITFALGCEDNLEHLFSKPAYTSIEEVIADARKAR